MDFPLEFTQDESGSASFGIIRLPSQSIDKSRNVSRILPLIPNPSRSEDGDVSPPPIGPIMRGGPSDPRYVGARTPPPSEMMDRIEFDAAVKISC